MFSHVMIGTNDLEKAKAFYDALLARSMSGRPRSTATVFSTSPRPACFRCRSRSTASPRHTPMAAPSALRPTSPEQADAWHAAGLANGGKTCENPPGVREGSAGKLYLAYLRDLDGNKICAMHRIPA